MKQPLEDQVERLRAAIALAELLHPLPRCTHGRALRDHAGDILTCPEGCALCDMCELLPATDEQYCASCHDSAGAAQDARAAEG